MLDANKHIYGKFMVRVPPVIHRMLALEAAESGISLNRPSTRWRFPAPVGGPRPVPVRAAGGGHKECATVSRHARSATRIREEGQKMRIVLTVFIGVFLVTGCGAARGLSCAAKVGKTTRGAASCWAGSVR